jgi:hypothetical protein
MPNAGALGRRRQERDALRLEELDKLLNRCPLEASALSHAVLDLVGCFETYHRRHGNARAGAHIAHGDLKGSSGHAELGAIVGHRVATLFDRVSAGNIGGPYTALT